MDSEVAVGKGDESEGGGGFNLSKSMDPEYALPLEKHSYHCLTRHHHFAFHCKIMPIMLNCALNFCVLHQYFTSKNQYTESMQHRLS